MITYKSILIVGLGGFLGSTIRFILSLLIHHKMISTFPFATFFINIIGSFCIGIIFSLGIKLEINEQLKLFLATGICGGFTTFSAFSIETLQLMQNGNYGIAGMYVLLSIIIGLFASYVGYEIFK